MKAYARAMVVAAALRAGTVGREKAAREAHAAGCSAQAVNAIRAGDTAAAQIVDEDAEALRRQAGQ